MPVFTVEEENSAGKYRLLHRYMLLPVHGLPSPFSEPSASRKTTKPAPEDLVVENIGTTVVPQAQIPSHLAQKHQHHLPFLDILYPRKEADQPGKSIEKKKRDRTHHVDNSNELDVPQIGSGLETEIYDVNNTHLS